MNELIEHLEVMLKARREHCEIVKMAGGWCSTCDKDIETLENTISILKQLEVK